MPYPDMFKNAMIQKMTGPGALSASALSKLVDVPQVTLSKWLRMAGVGSSYNFPNNAKDYSKMTKTNIPRSPNDWSAEEKLHVVLEAATLDDDQLGEFLRKKCLHKTHLEQWRLQMLDGIENSLSKKSAKQKKADAKHIRTLEKEISRKDKAMAYTASIFVLNKKVLEIWGDEDDPTKGSKGR